MLHWPNDYTVQRAVYELDAAALHTKHPRENLLGRRCFHSCWPHERSDRHNPASSGVGFVATQKRAGDARATLCPSWQSLIATETEKGREPA